MRAGELDQRITILRRQVTDNALGTVESWAPAASRWARVRRMGGSEDQGGGVVQAVEMLAFRMRRDAITRSLATTDRIRWRGADHVITAIAEDFMQSAWIEAQCSVRADL